MNNRLISLLVNQWYQDDYIDGGDGFDLVFGDHATISLGTQPYLLVFASTIEPGCTPGNDTIHLGSGDDIAFGGSFGDWIYGDSGQDIILGDFGLYNATEQFLRNQYFESIIDSPQWAGGDHIYGGSDDDFIMGQEGSDFIDGGSGADDITGGHNKRYGQE